MKNTLKKQKKNRLFIKLVYPAKYDDDIKYLRLEYQKTGKWKNVRAEYDKLFFKCLEKELIEVNNIFIIDEEKKFVRKFLYDYVKLLITSQFEGVVLYRADIVQL